MEGRGWIARRGQTREGAGPDPGGGGARPGRGGARRGRGRGRRGAGPDAGGGVEQGAESRAAFCLGKSWTLVLEMRGNTGKGHNGI